jgi:hypothetical protein
MFLFPFRNPLLKIFGIRSRGERRRGTAHGYYDPPSPRPSPPLRRGERVEGVGGCNTISHYKLSFWAAASAQRALAAASAWGRRPPKAGGGPTKYHRPAFRNSLHRTGIRDFSPSFLSVSSPYFSSAGGMVPISFFESTSQRMEA